MGVRAMGHEFCSSDLCIIRTTDRGGVDKGLSEGLIMLQSIYPQEARWWCILLAEYRQHQLSDDAAKRSEEQWAEIDIYLSPLMDPTYCSQTSQTI